MKYKEIVKFHNLFYMLPDDLTFIIVDYVGIIKESVDDMINRNQLVNVRCDNPWFNNPTIESRIHCKCCNFTYVGYQFNKTTHFAGAKHRRTLAQFKKCETNFYAKEKVVQRIIRELSWKGVTTIESIKF